MDCLKHYLTDGKTEGELYPVNLLMTKRWTTWSSRSVGFQPKVRITFRLARLADITSQTQVWDILYWRILNYYMFGNFPDLGWPQSGFYKIFIALLLITIADISQNRRWCTFLAILSRILALFGVLFTGLNSSVVYQNWQISGVPINIPKKIKIEGNLLEKNFRIKRKLSTSFSILLNLSTCPSSTDVMVPPPSLRHYNFVWYGI